MLTDIKFDPDKRVFPDEILNDFIEFGYSPEKIEFYRNLTQKDILARFEEGIYKHWDVNEPMLDWYRFESMYDDVLQKHRLKCRNI